MAVDQDGSGNVLLVTLDGAGATKTVTVEKRQVGKTRFAKLDLDAATIADQPALIERLRTNADPNLVLVARLTGIKRDELDIDSEEVETALAPGFLKIRLRDKSVGALSGGAVPPVDTILGAFIRDTEAKIAELEAASKPEDAAEARDVLRLGRLLLGGHEVTL